MLLPEEGYLLDELIYPKSQDQPQMIYPTVMHYVLSVFLKNLLSYNPLEYLPNSDCLESQVIVQDDQTACNSLPICIPRYRCVVHPPSQGENGFPKVPSGQTVPKFSLLPVCHINSYSLLF